MLKSAFTRVTYFPPSGNSRTLGSVMVYVSIKMLQGVQVVTKIYACDESAILKTDVASHISYSSVTCDVYFL